MGSQWAIGEQMKQKLKWFENVVGQIWISSVTETSRDIAGCTHINWNHFWAGIHHVLQHSWCRKGKSYYNYRFHFMIHSLRRPHLFSLFRSKYATLKNKNRLANASHDEDIYEEFGEETVSCCCSLEGFEDLVWFTHLSSTKHVFVIVSIQRVSQTTRTGYSI